MPTPTYDFVVVGGFHAPDDHAKSHPIAAANASFLNEQDSERPGVGNIGAEIRRWRTQSGAQDRREKRGRQEFARRCT